MSLWLQRIVGRRSVLATIASLPVALFVTACDRGGSSAAPAPISTSTRIPEATVAGEESTPTPVVPGATVEAAAAMEATPACTDDDDDPTVAQTEGPYFTPNSPERVSLLEQGVSGARLIIEGFVLSTRCEPVPRALIDFWQCDGDGVYDNTGYTLRGHQFSDMDGRWWLETIVPGVYPGRTRHIHVKVQAPGEPVLITQLYFPDDAGNASDRIYDARLLLDDYHEKPDGQMEGRFNFVLEV